MCLEVCGAETAGNEYRHQQAGEPSAKVVANHHYHPGRFRRLLDPVARAVAADWLLSERAYVVLWNSLRRLRRIQLRRILLAVLSQQSHQPVLLRAGQSAVSTRFPAHPAPRLAPQLN